MQFFGKLAFASVSLLALSTPALAQQSLPESPTDAPVTDGGAAPDEPVEDSDIIVTGTLIRGIAPGGSQTIGVNQEKIAAVGAVNTSDLIAAIPQAGNFLGFVGVRGSSNYSLAINRPSLRYLGNPQSSGATTLLLLDGHRLPGMAITQSSADLDAISPTAIERVEVVTDGGSATYGSDAIGGVMNFVTRKQFDGVQVKGSVGFAEDYTQYNAGLIVGKVWDTFSAYVAYDFGFHDELYGRDRAWSRNLDYITSAALGREVGTSSSCQPGNLLVGGTTLYALPGNVAGLGNRCDLSEEQTFYPRETKHSVFGRINFEPGGPISMSVSGYYVHRVNTSDGGPLQAGSGAGSTITSTNPFAAPFLAALPGSPASASYLYNFSTMPGGNSTPLVSTMTAHGVTPTVKIDVGGGWQLNVMANYGVGYAEFKGGVLNNTPINTAIAAGTFNPFNLAAPGNAPALAAALDAFQYGRSKHQLLNARAVADGPLFELPAGQVRVAVGVEHIWEKYSGNNARQLSAAGIAALADRTYSRSVESVFGEISIPVFSEDTGPFHSLTLSAAARYDHYSDVGNTFNPKFGAIFQPVDWLTLRGNWGKSFQAPGLSDQALSGAPFFNLLPLASLNYADPLRPAPATRPLFLAVSGTRPPLRSQSATTWSLGFDIKPPVLEGFSAGLTYYNIDFRDVIVMPPIFSPTTFYRDFPNNSVVFSASDPADAALIAYFNSFPATNTAATLATISGIGGFSRIYGILDSRVQNVARIKTSGLDFYVRYAQETGFGGVYADINGSYILKFGQQGGPGLPITDLLARDTTKLRLNSTIGADIGNLRAQVTWNHSQGYDVLPTVTNLQQSHVDSYNLFNLFFQYKVPGDSMIAKDLVFTVNVDNVFDTDPPVFRGTFNSLFGIANGFTLGRLVRLGVTKRFGGGRSEEPMPAPAPLPLPAPAPEPAYTPPAPPAPPAPPPPPPPPAPGERG